ncbi:MAG TPA: hypothetical protein VM425_13060 [Myxococcota bacterium]|nr:hypothetical protein [Myxococcota bacterium]
MIAGKAGTKKRSGAAGDDRLEEMVLLLLKASLRGRLLVADRRAIKKFLGQIDTAKKTASPAANDKPRCPVCRSVLENPRAKRCPYCSVLLGASRKRGTGRKK